MNRRSLLALVPLVLIACDMARRAAPPEDRTQLQRQAQAPAAFAAMMPLPETRALSSGMVVRDSAATASFAPGPVTTNMVIRTATASIEVDSLAPAVAALRQLAARVGGYVANTAIHTGDGQLHSATVEVKIPAGRFDDALAGLKPIGTLESAKVQADDVGEEYVDVTARMENARRLERRLIDLLVARTGKLSDVLEVERSLARVREDIERYEGRLRYLKVHAAMSTLTVYVHEPVPIVGSAGSSVMGDAFRQSWRNFVALVALLVQSLGVVLPLGALAAAGWVATRRWRRVISQRVA